MREGEASYQPGEAENQPVESEQVQDAEHENILGRFRRAAREYPPLKPITLSLGLLAGSIAGHFWEQGTIRERLVHEQERLEGKVDTEQSREAALRDKYHQLDSRFGAYSPFHAGQDAKNAERELQTVESKLQHFSWFEDAGKDGPLNQFAIRMRKKISSRGEKKPERAETADSLTISDVETLDGTIHGDELREVLLESFPKGWVSEEVVRIQQVPEKLSVNQKRYGLDDGEWTTVAYCENGKMDAKSNIVLGEATAHKSLIDIMTDTIPHELGHANDWSTDSQLSREERIELLLNVSDRLEKPDRFTSHYVEEITNKDVQLEKYAKATEYWAEICRAYFFFPRDMDIHDFQLVDRVVKESDPQFDVRKSIEHRIKSSFTLMAQSRPHDSRHAK